MNLKTAILVVIILFAATVPSITLGVSFKQPSQNIGSPYEVHNFVQPCNGTEVEPNRPIDTPGGPT